MIGRSTSLADGVTISGVKGRSALAVAVVLALSRYDACGCGAPTHESDVEEAPEEHADEQERAEPVDHPAPAESVHRVSYVLDDRFSQPGRFAVRGPGDVELADVCSRPPCRLDASWWQGAGRYVFSGDGEEGRVSVAVELLGDELEVSFRPASLTIEVVHRIDGVALRPSDDGTELLLVNDTDRRFETTFNDGFALFGLVRTGPDGWLAPRERAELMCGFGLEQRQIEPRTTIPLPVEGTFRYFRGGSMESSTMVVILETPPDFGEERRRIDRDEVSTSHAWAVTVPLGPGLLALREALLRDQAEVEALRARPRRRRLHNE